MRDWIEEKTDLSALSLALDDQRAFQSLAMKLLEDLELVEGEQIPEDSDDGGSEDEGTDEESQPDEGEDGEEQGGEGQAEVDARGEQSESDNEDGDGQQMSDDQFDDMDGDPGDDGEEGMQPVRPNRPFGDHSRRSSTTRHGRRSSTRSSPRPSCATRTNWRGCAGISTSSSSICNPQCRSWRTGCSAG